MYGDGLFCTQLEVIESILRYIRLFEERQQLPDKSQGASNFRRLPYHKVYAKCIADFVYDFRLTDQSLILFVKSGKDDHDSIISFSYYEAPKQLISYEDFVLKFATIDRDSETLQEDLEFWSGCLHTEFETYLETSDFKEVVTPIRYDYAARDYRTNIHPASHIHIGFETSIRIGCRKILTPICFLLFILRQRYPEQWLLLKKHKNFDIWAREIRINLSEVINPRYWVNGDENELYFI